MLCKIPWLLHQIALQFEVCTREAHEPESPRLSVCVSFSYVYFTAGGSAFGLVKSEYLISLKISRPDRQKITLVSYILVTQLSVSVKSCAFMPSGTVLWSDTVVNKENRWVSSEFWERYTKPFQGLVWVGMCCIVSSVPIPIVVKYPVIIGRKCLENY